MGHTGAGLRHGLYALTLHLLGPATQKQFIFFTRRPDGRGPDRAPGGRRCAEVLHPPGRNLQKRSSKVQTWSPVFLWRGVVWPMSQMKLRSYSDRVRLGLITPFLPRTVRLRLLPAPSRINLGLVVRLKVKYKGAGSIALVFDHIDRFWQVASYQSMALDDDVLRAKHQEEVGAAPATMDDVEQTEDQARESDKEEEEFGDAIEVDLDESQTQAGAQFVVIGRFLSLRSFSAKGLFDSLQRSWKLQHPMEYKHLENNRFLVEFQSAEDRGLVVRGGPWTYRGDAFLVAPYDGRSRPSDVAVNAMPVWVRIFDLPLPLMTEQMGRLLGAKLGTVRAVAVDARGRACDDDYMRVHVEHLVDRPLTRCLKVIRGEKNGGGASGKVVQRFEVKYERVPRFCSCCGRVGHGERDCGLPEEEKAVVRFGLGLRACASSLFEKPERHSGSALPAMAADPKKKKKEDGGDEGSNGDVKKEEELVEKEEDAQDIVNIALGLHKTEQTARSNVQWD